MVVRSITPVSICPTGVAVVVDRDVNVW